MGLGGGEWGIVLPTLCSPLVVVAVAGDIGSIVFSLVGH